MSNLLLVAMFLFWIVPMLLFKEYMLGLAFIIFGLVFGFVEFLSHFYTGKTVSQQVWALITSCHWKGYLLLFCMLCGWLCLLAHLGLRFKK